MDMYAKKKRQITGHDDTKEEQINVGVGSFIESCSDGRVGDEWFYHKLPKKHSKFQARYPSINRTRRLLWGQISISPLRYSHVQINPSRLFITLKSHISIWFVNRSAPLVFCRGSSQVWYNTIEKWFTFLSPSYRLKNNNMMNAVASK